MIDPFNGTYDGNPCIMGGREAPWVFFEEWKPLHLAERAQLGAGGPT